MLQAPREYILTFNQGVNYTQLHPHANSIFWAFNIPSWLHPSYKVRILQRIDDLPHNITLFVVSIDTDPAEEQAQFITLYFYEVLRDNTAQRLEYFVQDHEGPLERRNQMSVKLVKCPERKMFTITITDHQNLFEKKLKPVEDVLYLTKDASPTSDMMLEYNFIEPENIRYKKQLKYEHFHLAFQGGGAKGIAYVGAYKAIKIMLPNDKVTSVIGSSAGSMCALAIASQISPEQIAQLLAQMDKIPKDRTIKSNYDITPEVIAETQRIKIRMRQFLHQYGLFPNTFFNYFVKTYLEDEEFVHAVLDYALLNNQSIRDMLSLPTTQPVYVNNGECCGPQHPFGFYEKERLTNLYGFLQGKLMTGEKVLDITEKVIKKVLDKVRKENPMLFKNTFTANGCQQSNQILAKTVTMHQFYQFTGVELTCTGTDLDSQILRFFNQKTTPYLPVRMAVVMSASFPIAFEARKWKKEWGKYYVHHSNTRLEIDITGHEFSDGGILANLPVMYLDNQEMRPMIFSHMRTPSTKVYGFGLDEITEEQSPELQKIRQEKFSALRCKIIKQTPVCGICCYTCCCVPQNQYFSSLQVASVDDIPPLAFIKKMIRTYRHANTNLVMQIFRKSTYHFGTSTTTTRSFLFSISQQLIDQYKNIESSLVALNKKLKSMNNGQDGIIPYFKHVREKIREFKTLDDIIATKEVYKFLLKLLIIFISEEKSRVSHQKDLSFQKGVEPSDIDLQYEKTITAIGAKMEQINFKLEAVGREDYFVNMNDVVKQQERLIKISMELLTIGNMLEDRRYSRIKTKLSKMFQNFFLYYQAHFIDNMNGLIQDIKINISDLTYALSKDAKVVRNSRSMKQLHNFHDTFGYYQLDEFIKFSEHFNSLQQPEIKAERIYRKEEPAIIYYIEQAIKRRTSPNVHLVLQGRGTVPLLNLQAFKTVREYLREIESQQMEETLNIMVSLIINDPVNQKFKSFEIPDLLILVVARADLTLELQKVLKSLEEVESVDLGYIKYQIPPSLQKRLIEIRNSRRNQRCRITNVTTSGITVLLMLLTILGFQNQKVEEEMRIISRYTYLSPYKIQKKFQSYNWAIPMRCRIRELQDLMWEERFQIFNAMEMGINEHKLPLNFDVLRDEFNESRESIFESFREVLEYISTVEYNAMSEKDPRDYFSKKMSLNIGTKNYYKMNRDVSIATKAMVQNLVELFENQIKLAIFTSGNIWINDILEGFPDPNLHEWLWKGLIIENLIETMLVKKHIKKILSEKNIDPDIKLKDFYRVSPLKITLTFTAVDLTRNQFVFINQHTHPELPLWMALTSSTSLPLIFPKVVVRPVYLNKINPSEAERKLELLLMDGNQEHYKHLYTSGNLLDILPLDLLTSSQTRKLYFDDRQFTFLSFGNQLIEPTPEPRTFFRKFPKFCDYLKLLCTGLSKGFSVEPGRILTDKLAIVATYLNSHDNYIYEIYKGNLLRLPIRLGTLDFHKVGKGSSLAEQTLFQTQLSTFQKFSNTRRTYLQFILNDNKLVIRMISRDINNNDLQSKYRLEFKTIGFSGYQKLTKRAIEMDLTQERELYLRFYFVENKEIVEREYFIDIMTLLDPYQRFKGTYMLEYVKVLNTYLPPLAEPEKMARGMMPGPPIDMVRVRSIVNIENTGLFCQLCCSPLAINKEYYNIPLSQSQCYHCKEVKETRLICTNNQSKCGGIYCLKCCAKFYYKKDEQFKCKFGHSMEFKNHRSYKLLSEQQVPFVRCSCCQQSSLDFYEDTECETYVCLKCVVSLVDK